MRGAGSFLNVLMQNGVPEEKITAVEICDSHRECMKKKLGIKAFKDFYFQVMYPLVYNQKSMHKIILRVSLN